MNVLLLHPEIRTNEPPHHPPYGLLQLAAITDSMGFKVAVLDNNAFRLPIDAVRQEIKGEPQPKSFRHKGLEITIDPSGKTSVKTDELIDAVEQGILDKNFIRALREEVRKLSLPKEQWDIIGIGGLTTQYKFIKELAKVCREEHPAALMVAGGGFLSSQPLEMMRWIPEFDIGAIGESYHTWREIQEHVDDRNWKRVKGLVYRLGKKTRFSKIRPLIPEDKLDEEIPWPAYEFSPVKTYLMHSFIPYCPELMPKPGYQPLRLDVLASYGCPYRCSFCFHNGSTPHCQSQIYGKEVKGKAFRQHSPRYIVDLIMHLRLVYKIDFVSFIDENFTVNRKWFMEFCDLFEESDLATRVHWGCLAHVRTVDQKMLEKGRDVGLSYISYGGETASEKLLKQCHKGQNKEQMSGAIEVTQAAQINPLMTMIVGFPNTTIDDIIEDCQFYIDNQVHCIPFFLQPYPATELFKKHKDTIIEQHLTEMEKLFLEHPTLMTYAEAFDMKKMGVPSKKQFNKQLPLLKAKVRDLALERWVLELEDAVKISANLTDFNDVELAGLQYMLGTWNLERLKKFKRRMENGGKKTDSHPSYTV